MTEFNQIEKHIELKEFDQAETLIEKAMHDEPDHPDLYYLRGLNKSYQGKISQSIEDLKVCIKTDPRHTDAAVCLSIILNDIGHYEEAKKYFDLANQTIFVKQAGDDRQVDQRFALKHLELGDLYFRHRRYDEAIEEYNQCIRLNPAGTEAKIRRAKAFAKKGFMTRAIQDLQQLKVEKPHHSEVGIQLGLLHYSIGNLIDAQLEWESILENDPVNREAIHYLEMLKKSD